MQNAVYHIQRPPPGGPRPCGGHDLWTLAAHEVGHVVGLCDTYDEPGQDSQLVGSRAASCDFDHRTMSRADAVGLRKLSSQGPG